MKTQGESTITKEQLIENGWAYMPGQGPFPMEKDLLDRSDLEEGEEPDCELKLVIHKMHGTPLFALLVDGYLININPASIEELNAFEAQIMSVDPPF